MGIAGAAIATVISQGVSAILVTRSLMKSYGILKLELRAIRFHGALLKSELKIGLPGGIQSFGYSISNIIIQAVINNFGTDTAAAWAAENHKKYNQTATYGERHGKANAHAFLYPVEFSCTEILTGKCSNRNAE